MNIRPGVPMTVTILPHRMIRYGRVDTMITGEISTMFYDFPTFGAIREVCCG